MLCNLTLQLQIILTRVAAKALSVRGRGVTSSVQQVEVLTPDVSMATMKRQHRSLLGFSAEWTTRSRDQEGPCGPSRFATSSRAREARIA